MKTKSSMKLGITPLKKEQMKGIKGAIRRWNL